MPKRFTLDDLHLLRGIDAAGALTGAARRLGVNHSTAFRRLGALEARLGSRLFDRGRSGYVPTPAGEIALAAATRVLEDLDDLERRLGGKRVRPWGVVRLATTESLLGLVVPALAHLRAEHPEITVELVVTGANQTPTRPDAEIALRPAERAPEALVGNCLARIATAPYAAASYLAGRDAGLGDHAWLGFDDSLGHLCPARWLAAHVRPEAIVLRTTSLLALREAARAGLGAALLPCYLGDAAPDLRRVAPPLPEAEIGGLWLLHDPRIHRAARVRVVHDALADGLAARRALVEGTAG